MARRLFTFLSVLSLLLCAAMAVLWVRSHHYWLYKGVTFNSTRRADGGQFHYCVSTHPLGITISHHRLITAPLKTGWLPFSARCAPITRESLGDWYRADGGDGLAGIWWLFDAPRGDGSGSMYQLFIP